MKVTLKLLQKYKNMIKKSQSDDYGYENQGLSPICGKICLINEYYGNYIRNLLTTYKNAPK